MGRSPYMKLKPVPQHSSNPTKALREVKIISEWKERLYDCYKLTVGRWLINKHLTNPLRGETEPTVKMPHILAQILYQGQEVHSLIISRWKSTFDLSHSSSWDIMTHPPSPNSHAPPTPPCSYTRVTMLQPESMPSLLSQGGDDGWLKSYSGIKVESIKLCVCWKS